MHRLCSLLGLPRPAATSRPLPPRATGPRLEPLEDRITPTTHPLTTTGAIAILGPQDLVAGRNGVLGGSGTAVDPFVIEGLSINALPFQPGLTVANTSGQHVLIRNVEIQGGLAGVSLVNTEHVTIEDVRIVGPGDGILLRGARAVRMDGVEVVGAERFGIRAVYGDPLRDARTGAIRVVNSVVRDTGDTAIELFGEGVLIQNTAVVNAGFRAIHVLAPFRGSVIRNNRIDGAGLEGILITGSLAPGTPGTANATNSQGIQIVGNRLTGVREDVIELWYGASFSEVASNLIFNNTLADSVNFGHQNGIELAWGVHGVQVHDNVLINLGGDPDENSNGIPVADSFGNTVFNNRISGTPGPGIAVIYDRADFPRPDGNVFFGNQVSGTGRGAIDFRNFIDGADLAALNTVLADAPGQGQEQAGRLLLGRQTPQNLNFRFGVPGWVALAGDWDGDGVWGVGAFDPATGTWYLRNGNSSGPPDYAPFAFGAPGWLPVVGDWDGDGTFTVGVVNPATATWYLRNSNSPGRAERVFPFGLPGWLPVAGDWDGNGVWGVGAFDPAAGRWYLRDRPGPGAPDYAPFAFGAPGWLPVVGDWDGAGAFTVGVVDPASGTWHLRNSNSSGPAEGAFPFGLPGWRPVPGDWDGDRVTTLGTFTPGGVWYLSADDPGGAGAFGSASRFAGWLGSAGAMDPDAAGVALLQLGPEGFTEEAFQVAVADALSLLVTAGANTEVVVALSGADYQLADLPGSLLAVADAEARVIQVDPGVGGPAEVVEVLLWGMGVLFGVPDGPTLSAISPDGQSWEVRRVGPYSLLGLSPPGALPVGGRPASTPGTLDPQTGTWHLSAGAGPNAPVIRFSWGGPGGRPVSGDWDGDGSDTPGVVDPQGGWHLEGSAPFLFGLPGWVPVTGDWDGDGAWEVGAFDPATASWFLRNGNSGGPADVLPFAFGVPGWLPVVGDWDGDGTFTVGVVDPASGTWYLRNSNSSGPADRVFPFGGPGWVPVVGDWDGDGVTTAGMVDPSGVWYLRNRNYAGPPEVEPFAFGLPGWAPVAVRGGAARILVAGEGEPGLIGGSPLTGAGLAAAVSGSLARLEAGGVNPAVVGVLSGVSYTVGNLPGPLLVRTDPQRLTVQVDADAAGRGWFVDPSPLEDGEFALPGGGAAGQFDLLTAALRGMAQLFGLPQDPADPLGGPLATGTRQADLFTELIRSR